MAKHAHIFHAEVGKLGIDLRANVRLPWLARHGHLSPIVQQGLPGWAIAALDVILEALDGDRATLAAKTRGAMTADFLLLPEGVHVEYDELQHFTTARATTLQLYPAGAPLGFDRSEYAEIVDNWRAKGDKGFAYKPAAEFDGRAGRQRQRAYFDAFRDLAAPHFGNGPLIRIAAPVNDYTAAAARLAAVIQQRP